MKSGLFRRPQRHVPHASARRVAADRTRCRQRARAVIRARSGRPCDARMGHSGASADARSKALTCRSPPENSRSSRSRSARFSGTPRSRPIMFARVLSVLTAPRLARASARTLPGSPLWPFTHRYVIRCLRAASSRARHRSLFLTGLLSGVVQPRFFQLWIHSVIPLRTYSLSVNSSTSLAAITQHVLAAYPRDGPRAASTALRTAWRDTNVSPKPAMTRPDGAHRCAVRADAWAVRHLTRAPLAPRFGSAGRSGREYRDAHGRGT
jgi:hypothetical protein